MATLAAVQFEAEVKALIRRYGLESDLNVYEALGALDMCKAHLIHMAESARQPDPDDDDFGAGEPVPP